MLRRVGVQCQERPADCQLHLVLVESYAVRLGCRVSRATLGRVAADDRIGADVCVLHSGKLVGVGETVIATSEDIDSLVRDTIAYLNVGYRHFGEVDNTTMLLIDQMANLIMTDRVRFDSEFKEICYMWEYNREKHSTGTEFQEDHFR